MRIGIAGYGKMGSAMADRLTEVGARVMAWAPRGISAERARLPLASSAPELVEHSDIVISSLLDGSVVQQAYHGPSGLLANAKGKLFIEMSTVAPETQSALATRAAEAGANFLECAVSGSTGPARAGQLLGLAGGASANFQRARPLLDLLCKRVEHLGPAGAGATAKLAVNLPLLAFWQALGEATAVFDVLGKAPSAFIDLFADSAGAPALLASKRAAIIDALEGNPPDAPGFQINAMRKDLLLIMAEGDRRHLGLPVAQAALHAIDAAVAAGLGKEDCSALPAYWASRDRPPSYRAN